MPSFMIKGLLHFSKMSSRVTHLIFIEVNPVFSNSIYSASESFHFGFTRTDFIFKFLKYSILFKISSSIIFSSSLFTFVFLFSSPITSIENEFS